MLKKLMKNKRAQNTAEYAVLIALAVGAIIAMQTYVQRGLQARARDATAYMTSIKDASGVAGVFAGTTKQYEPYYLNTRYQVEREETERELLDTNVVRAEMDSRRVRKGSQNATFDRTRHGTGGEL